MIDIVLVRQNSQWLCHERGFFTTGNALASALSNDSRHPLDAGPFSAADDDTKG